MQHTRYDLAVIGGGPAGMAAALKARDLGIQKILIIERNPFLGGILPQCIHNGFGLKLFQKDLTGPEYNQVFVDRLEGSGIDILLSCTALSLQKKTGAVSVVAASGSKGIIQFDAASVVLALGCRERTRGQVAIHGTRPAGVYTAGFIQKLVNIEGYLPGKKAVILGSGDIGLIMARRLRLEGADVKGVYEIMPFSTGLTRNIHQCLKDYGIGLHLGHTVTRVFGQKKLEAVEITKVNERMEPLKGKKPQVLDCDCLLLSVGLIPENELSKTCGLLMDAHTQGPVVNESLHTSVEGIFSCGNSLFVNDIVDDVTEDGFLAAKGAWRYLQGEALGHGQSPICLSCGDRVAYVAPQRISLEHDVTLKIRARVPMKDALVRLEPIGFQKKVRHVLPGELISVKLETKKLSQNAFDRDKISKIEVQIVQAKNGPRALRR